jgi:hypothetical protein
MLDRLASFSRRDRGPLNRFRTALILALFILWSGAAQAASVVILWPSPPSADVTQALTLLRGELLSVGLEVTMSDRTAARGAGQADSLAWLEAFAARDVRAVIDTVADHGLEEIDVWILKTHPQRFEVTRVTVEPDAPRQAVMLALRTVEALRAGLLQIDWAARKRRVEPSAQPPTVEVPASEVHEPASPGVRVGIDVGAVAMMSLDGLGPAVLSTLRVGWVARPWLVVQASAAGLGSRSAVTTLAGSARVAQQYGVLGAFYRFRSAQRLWPFLGLAGGALHTSIEGQAGWGTGGHAATRWSGLIDFSLGAGLHLYGRSYLTLALHAQVAEPFVAIYIVETVGATSGRPNLLLTLTVGAWL